MKMTHLFRNIIMLLLCATLSSGCSVQTELPPELTPSVKTPPSTTQDDPGWIELSLYYTNTDTKELTLENRTIEKPHDMNAAHAAMVELDKGPTFAGLQRDIPSSLVFEGLGMSGQVCSVYFTGKVPNDEQTLLIMRAAIAQTIYANGGLPYTNIYINGSLPLYHGYPLGLMEPLQTTMNGYLLSMMQKFEEYDAPDGSSDEFETRYTPLYFTDESRTLMNTQVRAIQHDNHATRESLAFLLVGEIARGPISEEDGYEPLLPPDMSLLASRFVSDEGTPLGYIEPEMNAPNPNEQESDNNALTNASLEADNLLLIGEEEKPEDPNLQANRLPSTMELYMLEPSDELSEENKRLVAASLVYTVTGYLPYVNQVAIHMVSRDILAESSGAQEMFSTILSYVIRSDTYARSDFSGLLGRFVQLYYPDREGLGLVTVARSLPYETIYDPQTRLQALFSGNADPGLPITFLAEEDVISVTRHEENMLIVNFRAGFYEKLTAFLQSSEVGINKSTRERLVVYSIVNTLCEMDGITRVWLLEDGAAIVQSVGMIYLGNPLFENPGLVRE